MEKLRKIRDEREAQRCVTAARAAGDLGQWARAHGYDGRSLHAWVMNLARRAPTTKAVRATQPRLAVEGGAFLSAMYVEEEAARAQGLSGKKLLAHRRRSTRPIIAAFKRWLAAVEPTLLPTEPLMAAVRYYRLHGEALFRFVENPEVPIDNSPTEREFQNVAKLRLNMLFAGSTEGAHRACVLLGIVATCRAISVPIQAYLSLDLRSPRHPQRPLRAAARASHPGGVQAHPGLSSARPGFAPEGHPGGHTQARCSASSRRG